MRTVFIVTLLSAFLFGCAQPEERWLSKEEDDEMRATCEPFREVGGCVVLPAPMLIEMMRRAQRQRGTGV